MVLFLALLAVMILVSFKLPQVEWEAFKKMGRTKWQPVRRSRSEVELCEDMIAENWHTIRRRTKVNFSVYAKTNPGKHEQLSSQIKANDSQIKDRFRSIIASADLTQIRDPQLKYFKSEVKSSLDKILGQDLVDDVVVPKWLSPTGRQAEMTQQPDKKTHRSG